MVALLSVLTSSEKEGALERRSPLEKWGEETDHIKVFTILLESLGAKLMIRT